MKIYKTYDLQRAYSPGIEIWQKQIIEFRENVNKQLTELREEIRDAKLAKRIAIELNVSIDDLAKRVATECKEFLSVYFEENDND